MTPGGIMRKLLFAAAVLTGAPLLPAQAQQGCVEHPASAQADAVMAACSAIITANTAGKPELAAAHVNRAYISLSKGDLDAAGRDTEAALALDPDHAPAHIGRASVYSRQGRLDDALKELDTAIRLNPNSDVAFNNRGIVKSRTAGREADAIADFTQAIRLNASESRFYLNRASMLEITGQYSQAVADADKVKQLAPGVAASWNNACWARALWGQQLQTAMADCNQALGMAPSTAAFLQSRCVVQYRMFNYAEAIDDCNAALKRDPRAVGALYVRGLALTKNGLERVGGDDIATARRMGGDVEATYAKYGIKP